MDMESEDKMSRRKKKNRDASCEEDTEEISKTIQALRKDMM